MLPSSNVIQPNIPQYFASVAKVESLLFFDGSLQFEQKVDIIANQISDEVLSMLVKHCPEETAYLARANSSLKQKILKMPNISGILLYNMYKNSTLNLNEISSIIEGDIENTTFVFNVLKYFADVLPKSNTYISNLPKEYENAFYEVEDSGWSDITFIRDNGFRKGSVRLYLLQDNLIPIKEDINNNRYDPDTLLEKIETQSLLERQLPRASILDIAALFRARACFDFLLSSGGHATERTLSCAIDGGSMAIIKEVAGRVPHLPRGALARAVKTRSLEVFEFILERLRAEHPAVAAHEASEAFRASIGLSYVHFFSQFLDNGAVPTDSLFYVQDAFFIPYLLEHGASLSALNGAEQNALFTVEDVGCLRELIERGLSPCHMDSMKRTPLCIAAIRGDMAKSRFLVGGGACLEQEFEAVSCAVTANHLQLARFLVDSGVPASDRVAARLFAAEFGREPADVPDDGDEDYLAVVDMTTAQLAPGEFLSSDGYSDFSD